LTVESPVREVGFFGPKSEAIYCLTGSESLRLYHKDDGICRKDFGPQCRQHLSHQLALQQHSAGESHPPSPRPGNICPMEYLVDCHWNVERQELSLLAGSSKGEGAVFQVGEQGVSPVCHLRGGHRGVIRAWSSNYNRSSFFTVGEDARMCEWKDSPQGTYVNCNVNKDQIIVARKRHGGQIARAGGGKLRKPRSRMSPAPY